MRVVNGVVMGPEGAMVMVVEIDVDAWEGGCWAVAAGSAVWS